MAIFFDAPVTPDALTTFVREVPVNPSLALLESFPPVYLQTNTVDFAEIVRTNRTARYRSFDGRIHVSERDAGSEKRVNLLPLSSSLSTGEYERLQLEFARTGGTRQAALANAVYNDATNLTREVQNRLEQAWGSVMSTGKLTIDENGFQGEADFGVPTDHKVTAVKPWSDKTALALSELIAWHDVYVATTGGAAGAIRTSQTALRFLQVNTEIVNAVHGSTSGKTRVTLSELNELLANEGLPAIETPYDAQVDVDGVITRVIPADKLTFTPANLADLGHTAWGVSATALELVNSGEAELSFEEAAGIVGVVEKVGPPYRQFTYVDAVAMPILSDARRLFIADVL
ncbi:Phage major capsid protein E [Arthrobacter alpinus]|uniref:Phage major capsid protein E n=1 Tax=Arthrobacter alpinus TaxID=656366 RepID=A0A1H5GWE9_9MICC|nr:major capsid protein [Arthrobacter alpinus]SEE20017.1 Phage major capsid protein E [Arthrobacter alpinus]